MTRFRAPLTVCFLEKASWRPSRPRAEVHEHGIETVASIIRAR